MRIRWMKLLTALLMAVLMAVLPVCAVALEGADSQGADALLQQEDDEDSGEQAESEPEEPFIEDEDVMEDESADEPQEETAVEEEDAP